MKRISTLVLAMAFAFGGISAAQADGVDVKVKGNWEFAFGWAEHFRGSYHSNANRGDYDDNFIAKQRMRLQTNFIISEELQGVFMIEVGKNDWGNGHTRLDADQKDIKVKRSYIDWIIPQTEVAVRMGLQGMSLPSATWGSPVVDADVAGITVSAPITDMFGVTAFWARPFDADGHQSGSDKYMDEVDLFGLILPITGEGWSVTPWGMFGFIGGNSGIFDYMFDSQKYGSNLATPPAAVVSNTQRDDTTVWYAGVAFELNIFDPLTFGLDAMYGSMTGVDVAGQSFNGMNPGPGFTEIEMKGWLVAARLDYAMDWGTPGLFGWYGSGDDSSAYKDGELGRLPAFMNDGGNFEPTSFGFTGGVGIAEEGYVSGTGTGTWGVGIQIADVSFIEDLSHTLRVAYYRGTNDSANAKAAYGSDAALRLSGSDSMYLTDDDSVIEVNFDHQYKIYENLTAVVELGYMRLDTDKKTWNHRTDRNEESNAYKAQVMLEYKF